MFIVFMHIMEKPVSDIFSPCVFNNIMEVTFIFSPPRFFAAVRRERDNRFNFNYMEFLEILAINR
jgi:hypothetical protein